MFKSRVKLSVICPLRTNDGRSLDDSINRIKQEIASISGGVSQYLQNGLWYEDDGTVYEDTSLVLYTHTDEQITNQLSYRFEEWAQELEQEELLITIEQSKTVFVPGRVLNRIPN